MNERRRDGPFNGNIGQALAGIKQLTPLFGWVFALFAMFGFGFTSPGKQLTELNERIAAIEILVTSLVRLECSRSDIRDLSLANLNCNLVR